MLDVVLAIAHHLLVFGIFGVIFAEFVGLKGALSDTLALRRLARLDAAYGVMAVLILIIGFARATHAGKGWSYYSHNLYFWAKIATFLLIGLASIAPTLAFTRWRRRGTGPDAQELRKIRMLLHIELTLFALLPVFAALMARGFGQF